MDSFAVLSNYTWIYTTSTIVKRHFSPGHITLFTANIEDIAKKHDFGIDVIQMPSLASKKIFSFIKRLRSYRERFDGLILDYSFNFSTILMLLVLRFKKMFLIDLDSRDVIRQINKLNFLLIFIEKIPYFTNKILISISKKFRMSMNMGLPSELSIETTSACNLACRGCPTGLGQLKRPPMPISPDLFNKIIETNRRDFKHFDVIFPFLYGEPLLNKKIFDYLQSLRKITPPYTRIELHTNGNIENSRDIAARLLKTGIDLISIAIDGTDKTSYENLRMGGDFDLVCEFVKNLTSTKKEMNLLRPEIVIQMILTKYSQDKIEQFKELKNDLGAERCIFKEFFYEFTELSDEEASSLLPSKKELALDKREKERIINKKNNLCGWPYRSITIMCNGDVSPCCIDSNATLLNGLNVNDSTIGKVWNSSRYRQFRRDMLNGKIAMCNKCFFS